MHLPRIDAHTFPSKEKLSKFPRTCSYTHLSANFGDFFASLVLSFSQATKLLTESVTVAYSLRE